MSDESKKSELNEEDLEKVSGGILGGILRRAFNVGGAAGPAAGGGDDTGKTPGQTATEGMSPSQVASTKTT
jgi:bacteriocin-like protein